MILAMRLPLSSTLLKSGRKLTVMLASNGSLLASSKRPPSISRRSISASKGSMLMLTGRSSKRCWSVVANWSTYIRGQYAGRGGRFRCRPVPGAARVRSDTTERATGRFVSLGIARHARAPRVFTNTMAVCRSAWRSFLGVRKGFAGQRGSGTCDRIKGASAEEQRKSGDVPCFVNTFLLCSSRSESVSSHFMIKKYSS